MPRRTTQPPPTNQPLSIALIIEWTGERITYNSSSPQKIYPKTLVKIALDLILSTSTGISSDALTMAFTSGSLINMRKIMSLSNSSNFNMSDIGCVGGEGGYRLTLSLQGADKENCVSTVSAGDGDDFMKATTTLLSSSSSSTTSARKVQPVLNPPPSTISTPTSQPTSHPPIPPTPSPQDPITFLTDHIFPLPLLSSSLTPPLILLLKYMENVIKTPNNLAYKNRRTINTTNKTFQNTILTADQTPNTPTFPLTIADSSLNTPLKTTTVGPFMYLFNLVGFKPNESYQLVLNPEIDENKDEFNGLRSRIFKAVVEEFGPDSLGDNKKTPKFVDVVSQLPGDPNSPSSKTQFNPYTTFHHSTQALPTSNGKSKTEAELAQLKKAQESVLGKEAAGSVVNVRVMTVEVYNRKEKERREDMEREAGGGDGMLLGQSLKRTLDAQKKRETGGFTTKAMRDVENLKRSKVYKTSKIRIVMPDSSLVEVEFNNGREGDGGKIFETIEQVSNEIFVPGLQFGLYVTPPRMEIDVTKSWKSEGLVPTGKCFLYWKTPSPPTSWCKPDVVWAGEAGTVPTGEQLEVEDMDVEEKEEGKTEKKEKPKKEKVSEEEMIRRMMGGKKKR
ncbi:hypothetical protein TrLO_g6280 [Triparma laevis f. longispina]|uniref:UBX domain-containing protein n=1 Tax=Triparma laevis f. longispina TaxID=1714387 RepID=A0A9W7FRA9_9STRA|nr:hypothetical protein TrLO_g6280 [Triparma laevis f. longispina]